MFINLFRFQETAGDDKGGGGGGGGGGSGNQPAEWLKPFGEHAKSFESFKEPAELAKAWTDTTTELKTLKEKPAFDWRKEAAKIDGKDDESIAKALARYNDLPSAAKALVDAQTKIRSGELAKPLDMKTAKPEEVAAWRTANGIPAEPKGYFEKLPDGLVIGKDDQPIFDRYAALWHEHNLPPAAAHAMTKAYYDDIAATKTAEAKVDKDDALKCIAELRTVMGNDYDTNRAILDHWLEGMPAGLKDRFKDATLGDGTRLFNDSGALQYLMQAARQINPAAHLLPAGGEGTFKSIDTEIADIEKLMRTDRKAYNKDEKLQARYRDLVTAKQRLKVA